jgi:hypothetical protein
VANIDIANDAINSAKIQDGTVALVDLAPNSVASSQIVNGSVATIDLADAAVTPAKLGVVPALRLSPTAGQATYTSGASSRVTFAGGNPPEINSGPIYSTGDATRLTAPVRGIYQISVHLYYQSNSTGVRTLTVTQLNAAGFGVTEAGTDIRPATPSQGTNLSVCTILLMNAGDYIVADTTQNSGANIIANAGTTSMNFVSAAP